MGIDESWVKLFFIYVKNYISKAKNCLKPKLTLLSLGSSDLSGTPSQRGGGGGGGLFNFCLVYAINLKVGMEAALSIRNKMKK